MDYYKFADIMLEWNGGDFPLVKGNNMEQFRCKYMESEKKICFRACMVSLEKYTHFPIIKENYVYALFDVNGERMLIYHWGNRRFAFAIWPERISVEHVNECWFDPDMQNQPPLNADWFFGVSGLHKALLMQDAAILHASFINRKGKAVLFAAPSGTGKSTQAALWERMMKTETINGDRALLRKSNGIWNAYGYPGCGSSGICRNLTLPLQIIVILRQGEKNNIEEISTIQKIQALAVGIEVYPWDLEERERAIDLAELIVQAIPVICLSCRPDEGSVITLNNYLEEMEYAIDI